MTKQFGLQFVILLLASTAQKCCVSSNGAPGDTISAIAPNHRYNAELASQQQQQQQQQQTKQHAPQLHVQQPPPSVNPNAAALASHALYHPTAAGSGHADHRNSYNLLSEAMSQAVSNEFHALGSGSSADSACQADDLDCYSGNVQDRLGMEAIRTLHQQLDDDDNGNIDLSESDDFLREELKYDSGYEKRQKAFHFNDDMHISVKELWEAWLRSEVHNWTIEQTTDWLAQSVQLPQYVDLFKVHKVTGAALPRLAVNNMHYVGNVLGIKDPIHKQKIALKAMDVVLFGPPRETGTRWKDYILVTLLLSAIIGCWYAYQQNKNAKRHLRRMAQDMEGLQRAELSLQEMQKELERARMEQENVATEKMDLERRLKEAPSLSSSSSDLEVQQLKKEIEMLRTELSRAEIELVDNCWAPPPQLQSWLQYTYELESKNHLKKRVSAEKQLQSAREACEKLRKKRTSLIGAFVSTHGKSIDDVDRSIVEARNALGEVTHELQERLHRWKQIESCLGINIVNNNGLSYLESVLYGRNGGIGGSSKGSRGRMTSSTDDLDDDNVQGMIDSYSRSSISGMQSGCGGININNSTNTLRDDSSCSDDGTDSQSVQFYLGTAPPAPSLPSTASGGATRAHLALETSVHNHVGSNNNNVMNASGVIIPATAPASIAATAQPAVVSPHNSNSSYNLNDGQILRSHSTDLVPMEIYTYLSRQHQHQHQLQQQQQQQQQHHVSSKPSGQQLLFSGTGTGAGTAVNSQSGSTGGTKKMVKQHSTASQQSTSSTSSSVQSAPTNTNDSDKRQSPARWTVHERNLPYHEQQPQQQPHLLHQHLYTHTQSPQVQQQQQHVRDKEPIVVPVSVRSTISTLSAATSLQSLCSVGNGSTTTVASQPFASAIAPSYGNPKREEPIVPASTECTSLDGSLKKRKRRLRFPFGGSKKSINSNGSANKSKPT